MENQTIFELYTYDNKSEYFSNLQDILKSTKIIYKNLYTKQTSTAATTEFLSKKNLMNTLIFMRQKYHYMKS